MLMGSDINPFDSQETKPCVSFLENRLLCPNKHFGRYKNDPQIVAMTNLVSAYQRRDVQEAERILKGQFIRLRRRPAIADQPFKLIKLPSPTTLSLTTLSVTF